MSVVTGTDRRIDGRWGYHGVEPAPAWLIGSLRWVRPARTVAVVGLLCAAVVVAVALPSARVRGGGGVRATVAVASGQELPIVPTGAVGPISTVLGRDLAGYRVTGLTATNTAQDLRAAFSSTGVTIVSGRLRLGIALDGYGYANASGALAPVTQVAPVARENRALYPHGAMSAWWVNGPAGLEQGFTVSAAPGVGLGPLTFSLRLTGDLRARTDGGGLYLSGPGGALRYDDLAATDARGRALPARFVLRDGQALIEVDDRGAAYPVRVDPLVRQSGEVISSGGTPGGDFGRSVAVSGNTVAVAADNQTVGSREDAGAVYVFVEPAGGWSELMAQTAELVASDPQDLTGLGWSLAMSGNTIVAGTITKCNKAASISSPCLNWGAAYVFEQPAAGWSGTLTQNAVLTSSVLTQPTGNARPGLFGSAVAISGGTIVVGADGQPVGSTNAGAAFMFEQPAGGWFGAMTQDAELTPSDPANNEYFGDAALAVSGSTVVVGAPGSGAPTGGVGHGAAYVFEGPATGWHGAMTQSAELTAPAGAGNAELGGSVAVSGGTVAVGAPALNVGSNVEQGAVFVYNEPASGWTGVLSPAAELTASDGTADNSFGTVAVSGSTIAVAGSSRTPGSLNRVYLFTQPASGWSGHLTESSELVASNEEVPDAFGSGVALSCSTVVVGAPGHRRLGSTASQGAAYVFAPPTTSADRARQPEFQAPVANLPGGGCPLDVQVKVLENLRSGLAVDDGFRKEGPVNFTIPTYSRTGSEYSEPGEAGQKCESGCANVLVTVTDPLTGKAVVGAKVTATVDPINVHHYGDDFLCAQSDEAHVPCGTGLSGLLTDQKGQIHLIYWAPGVVRQASTVLHITVKNTCTAEACPTRLEVGQKNQALQIKPYVIYEHTGELSKIEVEALVEMVRNPGTFSLTNELAKEGFKVPFEAALEWLVGEEEEAELVVESIPDIFAEPLFGLIEAAHVAFELHEQDELVAAFLKVVALPAIGLYDPPRESKAPAPPSGLFESTILHGIANPLHLSAGGVLFDDAEILSGQLKKLNDQLAARPEEIHMAVYEVSNCDQADPSCGPGYKFSDGINPQLCFDFDGSDGYPGAWADSFCISQYDAFAFAESMGHRLNTALP